MAYPGQRHRSGRGHRREDPEDIIARLQRYCEAADARIEELVVQCNGERLEKNRYWEERNAQRERIRELKQELEDTKLTEKDVQDFHRHIQKLTNENIEHRQARQDEAERLAELEERVEELQEEREKLDRRWAKSRRHG